MNNVCRILSVWAIMAWLIHGCAVTPYQNALEVKALPSNAVRLVDIATSRQDHRLLITGNVVRLKRVQSSGYVYAELIDAAGTVVASARSGHVFRRSGANVSRMAPFSIQLELVPSAVMLVVGYRDRD